MNAIDSVNGLRAAFEAAQGRSADPLTSGKELTEREAFQSAVAGTFFKMMIKSMHKMHGQAACPLPGLGPKSDHVPGGESGAGTAECGTDIKEQSPRMRLQARSFQNIFSNRPSFTDR